MQKVNVKMFTRNGTEKVLRSKNAICKITKLFFIKTDVI